MSAVEIEVFEELERTEAQSPRVAAECLNQSVEPPSSCAARIDGVVTGFLVGFRDEGHTPLITYPNQPGTVALAAGAVLDLHGFHIGRKIVLMFENGDPTRPIVMGLLHNAGNWPLREQPGEVQVDVDGARLLVNAKEQLVLRCGKASVTLTKEGKVLIQGTYISNRSSGVVRVKGGSVQLN